MSELRYEKLTIPAANLGPENPLPPLHSTRDIHAASKKAEIPGIPDEILRNMAYGHIPNIITLYYAGWLYTSSPTARVPGCCA